MAGDKPVPATDGWATYGSLGSGKGQFNYPCGIHYDSGSDFIYVADWTNHRIVKTMLNGTGWTTYGTYGTGTGEFYYPCDIIYYSTHYSSDGHLTSRRYNYGAPANLLTLSWVGDTPPGTYIKFQLRSAPNESALFTKKFVGPNGKATNFYNTSGANIWSGHDGDKWIQYKVYLNTSDLFQTPILKDVTIIYNLLPNRPTLVSPMDKTWTNDNTTTFTWSFNDTDSSSQVAFQWQVDDVIEFNDIDYDSEIINSGTSSYTQTSPIADGIWYWRLRTKDSDNGWGPFSSPWRIFIDTKSPTSKINFPKNNSFYNSVDLITGTASDPDASAGINKVELAIKRLGDNDDKYWDGSGWTAGVSWLLASGTAQWEYNSIGVIWSSGIQYQIQTRAWDNVTNLEIPDNGNRFTFDTDNPTSTIEIPLDNSFYNKLDLISGSSSDAVADGTGASVGVKKVEILFKRLSDDHYWDGSAWHSSETWLKTVGTDEWIYDSNSVILTTKTQYIIYSRATDKINNIEMPIGGNRFTFDTDDPSSTIEIPSDNSWMNDLDIISGNATDIDGSGIDTVEISIKPTGKSGYWDGSTWTSDICWLLTAGGEYMVL